MLLLCVQKGMPEVHIELKVLRGKSDVCEDFSRANVWVWLVSQFDKIPLSVVAGEDGVIRGILPFDLCEGVYSVKAVYVKDMEEHHHHAGARCRNNTHEPMDIVTNGKMSLVEKQNVFCVVNDEDNYVNRKDATVRIKAYAASYGYDGLSAYELSVMKGKTVLTEDEWLDNLNKYGNGSVVPGGGSGSGDSGDDDTGGGETTTLVYKGMTIDGGGINGIYTGAVSKSVTNAACTLQVAVNFKNKITIGIGESREDNVDTIKVSLVCRKGEKDYAVQDLGNCMFKVTIPINETSSDISYTLTPGYDGELQTDKSVTIVQAKKPYRMCYGSALVSVPLSVSDIKSVDAVEQTITVTTSNTEQMKSHWVAIPKRAGFKVSEGKDIDGDTLDIETKEIGDYDVYYISSPMYIDNTSKFTIVRK